MFYLLLQELITIGMYLLLRRGQSMYHRLNNQQTELVKDLLDVVAVVGVPLLNHKQFSKLTEPNSQ